jgi:phosphatidylserine/phosphatidylglycerophosphate/cardiolipin synthase-like enzyme
MSRFGFLPLLCLAPATLSLAPPKLSHTDWFLTKAEILEAMGGSFDRSEKLGMAVFTTENEVVPFNNGENMFRSVLDDVMRTDGNSSDFIYYTAWAIQPNVTLDPRKELVDTSVDTTVGGLWTAAIQRGVRCLTLLWRNEINLEITRAWTDQMSAAAKSVGADESQARSIVDGRTKVGGSHHQKSLVIKRDDEAVAYVGGIDITHDRWDSPEHCCGIPEADRDEECAATCKVRETEPSNFRPGWQDISVKLRGPIVLDVAANFVARWNDDERPSNIYPFLEPAVEKKAPRIDASLAAEKPGTVAAQLLRTYACSYQPVCLKACYADNAPDGDTSYLTGLVKAISLATNYVYIEDQYGIFMKDIFDELEKALERGLGYIVVLIQPPDPEADLAGYSTYQSDMWDPLKEKFPGRVLVYSRNDGVYVHSKLTVVDDVWMSIGSQNMNYRSMTSDSELGVALVDDETVVGPDGFAVAKSTFEFRTSLWAWKLGMSGSEVQKLTLDEAVKMWNADNTDRRVVEYAPTAKSPYGRVTQKVVDADGRCYGFIKGEEEEEEEKIPWGGYGGDISEISKL